MAENRSHFSDSAEALLRKFCICIIFGGLKTPPQVFSVYFMQLKSRFHECQCKSPFPLCRHKIFLIEVEIDILALVTSHDESKSAVASFAERMLCQVARESRL